MVNKIQSQPQQQSHDLKIGAHPKKKAILDRICCIALHALLVGAIAAPIALTIAAVVTANPVVIGCAIAALCILLFVMIIKTPRGNFG